MADTIKEDQENEESMFRTLLNKVPANMRFLAADLVGMDSKATNEKFTDEGLAILKEAAVNALDKGKSSMTYEDYPGGEMNFNKDLLGKMADKNFQMRTTIGSANLRIDENGDIMIVPQYLWHYTEPNKINFKKRILSFDFVLEPVLF